MIKTLGVIKKTAKHEQGFTLTEILMSVAIMGVLTSIATPPLIENLHRARQSEASSLLSQLAVSAATYKDEFGEAPTTWEDLSQISAVMTSNGPTGNSNGELTTTITSANGDFDIKRSSGSDDYFVFIASPTGAGAAAKYNVVSCIDLSNGASDIRLGGRNGLTGAATISDLTCKKSIPSPTP